MNETVHTIMNRRSIRSFNRKQITGAELKTILEAGMYAPSAKNQQSAYFVVVQNNDLLQELAVIAKETTGRDTNPYYDAPTVVFVYAKKDNLAPVQDACLAIENMFLAAASLGIGSCWINCAPHVFSTEKGHAFEEKLGVDEENTIVASFILGYCDSETPEVKPRKEKFYKIIK